MSDSVFTSMRASFFIVDLSYFSCDIRMDDGFSSHGDNLRANWTPPQDNYFVDLLVEQVRKGSKTGHGFRKQAWTEMIVSFNSKFGFKYDTDVLKNRYKRLRKQYNDMKILIDRGEFKWDESQKMITADDDVWDDYIKANPEMQPYTRRVVPYYNDLCTICGHAVADGRYSLSCFDLDFESEVKEIEDETPMIGDPKKIEWSQSMDQFFIELMLDQVHKGNKIGRNFKKKSWVYMITSFNTKFAFHYSRSVLKNRYIILRRHYCSIKILLSQKGFSWNDKQQKVLADDQVWDDYVMENPNFRMYRNKMMPCYTYMCIICGNEAARRKTLPTRKPIMQKETLKNNANGEAKPVINKSNSYEQALCSDGIKNPSDQKRRAQPKMTPTLQPSKRERRTDDCVADALDKMTAAVSSLTKGLGQTKKEKSVSAETVIKVLQTIPDIDDDLLLDACDFLEDERRARTFLALDSTLRKKWLVRKLRLD
ncbi:L10-interacting MYB domain-containing protein isoform X2 [Ziziphus jujuba]|uniref:L10-interacting MYB domain-containing protein isoform X2 n=1 Tax=Ziziphus jujuba TaxID=326968 RepID=A0A6P6FV12_ZIZJJ|nr:L10-interacting MYB domain-containing protein isoform X2 [Ziziphus jujuba]